MNKTVFSVAILDFTLPCAGKLPYNPLCQAEENYYRDAKEEDFLGNVLKKKFFRDVQEAKKRGKTLGQKVFTCLDGELYENDEVRRI